MSNVMKSALYSVGLDLLMLLGLAVCFAMITGRI